MNKIILMFLIFSTYFVSGQENGNLRDLMKIYSEEFKREDSIFNSIIFSSGEKIKLEFYLEGREKKLDNNFEVFFIIQDSMSKIIIKPQIDKSSFYLPDFYDYKRGIFGIKYKKKFYCIYEYLPKFSRNDSIRIIFDSKPFYKGSIKDKYNSDIYSEIFQDKYFQDKEIKAILYISFLRTWVNTKTYLNNEKKYFKENKRLIE